MNEFDIDKVTLDSFYSNAHDIDESTILIHEFAKRGNLTP